MQTQLSIIEGGGGKILGKKRAGGAERKGKEYNIERSDTASVPHQLKTEQSRSILALRKDVKRQV